MAIRIFTIDAFTHQPFSGNPAAVCLLDDAPQQLDEAWMQAVAAEMNLSETAFVRRGDDEQAFGLRWFTPVVEVPLCGHATLASAHVLYDEGILSPDRPAQFDTLSGRLTAKKSASGIEMDFPLQPVSPLDEADIPDALHQGLGVTPTSVAADNNRYVVEIADEMTLRNLRPDLALLSTLGRGVVVTCRAKTGTFDFISRNFLPHRGIPEDPVTGASHCSLAHYWQSRLNKASFTAYQASKRGGVIGVRIIDDRVILIGQAVTVLRGTLEA